VHRLAYNLLVGPLLYGTNDGADDDPPPTDAPVISLDAVRARRRTGERTYHSGVQLAWRNPAAQATCNRQVGGSSPPASSTSELAPVRSAPAPLAGPACDGQAAAGYGPEPQANGTVNLAELADPSGYTPSLTASWTMTN
jgi:hypothetical protein